MRKFFAIFVAITLWNASALEAALQASICENRSLSACREDAQIKSVNGNEYRCCSCTISSGTGTQITYNCDEYADDGYELRGSYCVKGTTSSEDERGYIETSYGDCLASPLITNIPKIGSIMYLYKTSDGIYSIMPTICAADFEERIE